MPYWRKFTMYVIVAVSVTFGIAYLLGSLGRVINIIFSFAAGYVGMIIARRISVNWKSEPEINEVLRAMVRICDAIMQSRSYLERLLDLSYHGV